MNMHPTTALPSPEGRDAFSLTGISQEILPPQDLPGSLQMLEQPGRAGSAIPAPRSASLQRGEEQGHGAASICQPPGEAADAKRGSEEGPAHMVLGTGSCARQDGSRSRAGKPAMPSLLQ